MKNQHVPQRGFSARYSTLAWLEEFFDGLRIPMQWKVLKIYLQHRQFYFNNYLVEDAFKQHKASWERRI